MNKPKKDPVERKQFALRVLAYVVALNGLIIIFESLIRELRLHGPSKLSEIFVQLPLLFGLTLIYLSTLLRRYKRTAWGATIVVYAVMLSVNVDQLVNNSPERMVLYFRDLLSMVVVPLIVLVTLILCRTDFTARSDIRSFGASLRFAIVILAITFVYGTVGFMLMDTHDFHQEISLSSAMHHTVDQFGLTTTHQLVAHTKRARYFLDSLSIVSLVSIVYVAISLFQPLKARLEEHVGEDRNKSRRLLEERGGSSEDIFKLWPKDKAYFINKSETSSIAYKVQSGVALSVGDPAGEPRNATRNILAFEDMCFTNDWLPAFIHTEPKFNTIYENLGYTTQKIGEEPVVDIAKFCETTKHNKYFRNIINRFEKLNYSSEMMIPPHNEALLSRLAEISSDWLKLPGRTERGFVMGYFNDEYMQQSNILIARDEVGTIRAFINQVESFDKEEANFDLLRYSHGSHGNINDYVLIQFLEYLNANTKFGRLNLGLCPLTGLDEDSDKRSVVSSVLKFAYSNGDRFYSFSGLYRFKSKYEPEWSNRYVVFKGGVSGFTRTMNALVRAMSIKSLPQFNIFKKKVSS